MDKKVLIDQMPGLYAVGMVKVGGENYYAAASENRGGKVFLVKEDTLECHEIEGGLGGVMAVIPGGDGVMLCIEEFYPVFDSATAKVIAVKLEKEEGRIRAAGRVETASVPYVHRIGLIREEDGVFLAAGKLCRVKAFPDDWSSAGTMEIAPLSGDRAGDFTVVCEKVFKHHAMFIRRNERGFDDLFFGGAEGTFRTVRRDGQWMTEKILDVPTSDIVVADLDGDGKEELAIIEQFHGDNVAVFKEKDGEYVRCVDIPVTFGHVLWGGAFLGRPALIAGSRGGEKKLTLYRFGPADAAGTLLPANRAGEAASVVITEETVIDEGQAPAQILVIDNGSTADIIAANHGAAMLVRYRFQQ